MPEQHPSATGDAADASAPVTEPVPLVEPRDGVPEVLTTPEALADYVAALAAGTGPVAVDAERASGFRYGQRAYLVQVRREGAGTALIDPIALPDLSGVDAALRGVEWVLHAANQDLACLAEVGMRPDALFDTELAGRLLGRDRVGLGAIVASELGYSLAKEHSAADWSTRPLPPEWLRYAALDVEVLVELRDALAADLVRQGKDDWAAQEFEAVRVAPPPPPRVDPWRRTTGIPAVKDARRLAVVREMWHERDETARERDIAPGRVLPDRAIVAAALALPRTRGAMSDLPEFSGRGTRRRLDRWWGAVARVHEMADGDLPPRRAPGGDTMPAPRGWSDRFPEAAERLRAVRATMRLLAIDQSTPQENLLAPDLQRRLAWDPPSPTPAAVAQRLRDGGARPWQAALVAPVLAGAISDPSAVPDVP
ncbi:HRDC domain-containing protein [Litorihabitans aurantiacus]|uniref:3'-5' exonuclease n=1 Tax=Litorihabitans aurantiacus TaxID=1930061 RepID=A0AA37XE01_9MICO|nr:HRDC domain-containing protein [Litorihabitans aurantiacus]GMA31417.1 3'-5' exonuclease [Litorihabitans aurantiacus]